MVEPELEGPPEMIARFAPGMRRLFALALFVYAGLTIFSARQSRLRKDYWHLGVH